MQRSAFSMQGLVLLVPLFGTGCFTQTLRNELRPTRIGHQPVEVAPLRVDAIKQGAAYLVRVQYRHPGTSRYIGWVPGGGLEGDDGVTWTFDLAPLGPAERWGPWEVELQRPEPDAWPPHESDWVTVATIAATAPDSGLELEGPRLVAHERGRVVGRLNLTRTVTRPRGEEQRSFGERVVLALSAATLFPLALAADAVTWPLQVLFVTVVLRSGSLP